MLSVHSGRNFHRSSFQFFVSNRDKCFKYEINAEESLVAGTLLKIFFLLFSSFLFPFLSFSFPFSFDSRNDPYLKQYALRGRNERISLNGTMISKQYCIRFSKERLCNFSRKWKRFLIFSRPRWKISSQRCTTFLSSFLCLKSRILWLIFYRHLDPLEHDKYIRHPPLPRPRQHFSFSPFIPAHPFSWIYHFTNLLPAPFSFNLIFLLIIFRFPLPLWERITLCHAPWFFTFTFDWYITRTQYPATLIWGKR